VQASFQSRIIRVESFCRLLFRQFLRFQTPLLLVCSSLSPPPYEPKLLPQRPVCGPVPLDATNWTNHSPFLRPASAAIPVPLHPRLGPNLPIFSFPYPPSLFCLMLGLRQIPFSSSFHSLPVNNSWTDNSLISINL